jgi:hypothetical protein
VKLSRREAFIVGFVGSGDFKYIHYSNLEGSAIGFGFMGLNFSHATSLSKDEGKVELRRYHE